MTTLNYFTIATSLLSIAVALNIIVRPQTVSAWQPRTVRVLGTTTLLMATLTIVLTFTNTH